MRDPVPRHRVFLALGSNLEDRLRRLREGVEGLSRVVRLEAVSSVYESRAVGYREQPDFLNAVVAGRTALPAEALLAAILGIEAAAGRVRRIRHGPRTLDIDLLFYGDRVIAEAGLTVPHPRWRERAFVLRPLLELAPGWRDPVTGWTVKEVWRARGRRLEPARIVAPPRALGASLPTAPGPL